MSLLSRIRSWLKFKDITDIVPPGKKLVFSPKDIFTMDFTHGVEIFNDDTTTMEFVVSVLINHFNLKKSDAILAMSAVHNYGSIVLPVDTREHAEQVAQLIIDEAREQDYPLACEAVSDQQVNQEE